MVSRFSKLGGFGCMLVLLSFAAGCGGSGSSTELRVVQASPSEFSASANVLVNGTMVNTQPLLYAGNTGYLSVNSGTLTLEVDPVGSSTPIVNQMLSLASTTETTVIVANFSPQITGIVLTDDNTAPSAGQIALRIVNASPTISSPDIYVVPAGSSLNGSNQVAPIATSLGFGDATSYQTLTAGTYTVYFTQPGTKNSQLSSGQISLTTGQVRTIVALNSPGGGFTSTLLADLN